MCCPFPYVFLLLIRILVSAGSTPLAFLVRWWLPSAFVCLGQSFSFISEGQLCCGGYSCFGFFVFLSALQILPKINWWSPCLHGQLLEIFFSLLVSHFIDFFLFLEFCHCFLHISRSHHLLQSLLPDFGGEIPSISPISDPEAFLVLLRLHLLCMSFLLLWQNL